jgi:hypothetical protein
MNNKLIIDKFLKQFKLTNGYLRDSQICIETNESTYLPKEELEKGWLYNLYFTYSAQEKDKLEAESVALVGVGPAVEALLFVDFFKIRKLFCFDVNRAVLSVARNNIINNLIDPSSISLTVEYSDLLSYLIERKIKVNVIYENLPNLRLSSGLLIEKGVTSASFYSEQEDDFVPKVYDECMLRLHYYRLEK